MGIAPTPQEQEIYERIGRTIAELCAEVALLRAERDDLAGLAARFVNAVDTYLGGDHGDAALAAVRERMAALDAALERREGWTRWGLAVPVEGGEGGR